MNIELLNLLPFSPSIPKHCADVEKTVNEYFCWGNSQSITEYGFGWDTETMIAKFISEYHKYIPPDGIFYLAQIDGETVGIGGLKRLSRDTAELKRLFVTPTARGIGIAKTLLLQLIEDAKTIGYTRIVLESARFMREAHGLYQQCGFSDMVEYSGMECSSTLKSNSYCMEISLL